jgi:hypothetical protein
MPGSYVIQVSGKNDKNAGNVCLLNCNLAWYIKAQQSQSFIKRDKYSLDTLYL